MNFVERNWLALLVVLSALPGLCLLVRGLVWGADSFAYWSVSCGNNVVISFIHSPFAFVWFLQHVLACNLECLALVMWVLYFFALLGIYFFGRKWFKEKAYLLPIYVACLTPLFFIEALRFEQEFFGWTLAFVALGCFSLFAEKKSSSLLIIGVLLAFFSLIMWFPSIFILLLAVFLLDLPLLWYYVPLGLGGLGLLLVKFNFFKSYFLSSFNFNPVTMISEEIVGVGLVFILHVLHFYKKIPLPLTFYGWFLLLLGILKSKYMFLAVLPLIMGLLWKELQEGGLSIPKLGINKIPVLGFCLLLAIGWFFMGLNMFPTQQDVKEMQSAIQSAKDLNVPLYNDWGTGWTFVSLGFDTNYRASIPQPDWNNLKRPFVAWSREEINGCIKESKYTQKCN